MRGRKEIAVSRCADGRYRAHGYRVIFLPRPLSCYGFSCFLWKDNERRVDDENTQVLYGPEGKELLDDFVTGELYYDNKLILGQKFLFGYHIGPIIKYSDIRAAYLQIYKKGFFETKRYLVCEIKQADGSYEDVKIARPEREKHDSESEKVAGVLCERNPAIQLQKTR